MLEEALEYPARGDWKGRTIRGGLLVYGIPLLVPVVCLAGYTAKIFRQSGHDDEEPPAFDDWPGLFRHGLPVLAVWVGFAVVPWLALWVAVSTGLIGGTDTVDVAVGVLAGVGALVLTYLAPAISAAVATADSTGTTGALRMIVAVGTSLDYLLASLSVLVVWFTAFAVGIMLLVTVFGVLAWPAVLFLALVVSTRRYAHAYAAG